MRKMTLALALRTGWSEQEILSMSPLRVMAYLELLTEDESDSYIAVGVGNE